MNTGIYVVMGVAGSGKSLIGAALAHSLEVDFVDGDDLHSGRNIKRMAAGTPLNDKDREAWLRAIAKRIQKAKKSGTGVVVACSALKRSYREVLRSAAPDLRFIFLNGPRELIAERLANRGGHFMPPALLDSQIATLEEPSPEENAWVCDITKSPEELIADIVARITPPE
ncbi:MAG: gluconokinase [Gemmatimonadaceae bacterium]